MLSSVNNVLIVGLGNLYNAIFFSAWFNLPIFSDSNATVVELSSSRTMLSFASVDEASVPSKTIWPSTPVVVDSNTVSAVKSWPLSGSSIKKLLVSENMCVTIFDIVKSALDEFSTIWSVSALSDTISFSPVVKVPETFVSTTWVPLVSVPKTKPVAFDEAPLTLTPPLLWLAVNAELGLSFNVKYVNGLISKRYNLNTASVFPIVPDSYCIVLALATPICVPEAVPLVDVTSSNSWIVLYAVVSPEISVTSGWPYTFVILTKFPNSAFIEPAFTVSNCLDFSTSLKVIVGFSNSYPFTYALPGDIANINLPSSAVPPSLVVSPEA